MRRHDRAVENPGNNHRPPCEPPWLSSYSLSVLDECSFSWTSQKVSILPAVVRFTKDIYNVCLAWRCHKIQKVHLHLPIFDRHLISCLPFGLDSPHKSTKRSNFKHHHGPRQLYSRREKQRQVRKVVSRMQPSIGSGTHHCISHVCSYPFSFYQWLTVISFPLQTRSRFRHRSSPSPSLRNGSRSL